MKRFIKPYKSILILSMILASTLIWTDNEAMGQIVQDTTGFHLNSEMIGARTVALANNSVSDAQSIASIYTNPAGFLFSESQASLAANVYYNHRYNVSIENIISVPVRTDRYMFALGAAIQHPGPGSYLESPQPSHVSFNQYDFSVFHAVKLSSTFSAGAGITASYGHTDEQSEWAVITNAGFFYAPSTSLSYGLSYSGVASELITNGGVLHYYPLLDNTGQASSTLLVREKAPHRLELGATFRFPSMSRTPDFKLSLSNEKVFGRPGLIYKAGLEYYPVQTLAIRGGYFIGPENNGGRLGLGLFFGNVVVDYAFAESFTDVRGFSHLISVSFGFTSSN